MPERQPIPKSMRFEVFKRDKFTCQYCGANAAQKLLHCDHVEPVAAGGETTLLNLITACIDCNLGKGARPLSDDSAVTKQHRQLAEMEERRQQLEMMREWRTELAQHQVDQVEIVCDAFLGRSKFVPNDNGKIDVRRWLRKYGLPEVLEAIDETFDHYLTSATESAWEAAFKRIPRTLSLRQQEKTDPHIRKLVYIQAVLRNRWDMPREQFVEALRKRLDAGYDMAAIEAAAKGVAASDGWKEFDAAAIAIMRRAAPQATHEEAEAEEKDPLQVEADIEMEESLTAWHDDEWHIEMWAACFGDTSAGRLLKHCAGWTRGSGYVDTGMIVPEDFQVLRGLHAVGLIRPVRKVGEIAYRNEQGNLVPSFQVPPLSPREATRAFNRFGTLKLGFWAYPGGFARVDQVH